MGPSLGFAISSARHLTVSAMSTLSWPKYAERTHMVPLRNAVACSLSSKLRTVLDNLRPNGVGFHPRRLHGASLPKAVARALGLPQSL
eukprot:5767041-Amphidinium_carterae.1